MNEPPQQAKQPLTSLGLCLHLGRWSVPGLVLSSCLSVWAAPADSVRVVLPPQATPSIQNTARILERQVAQRCGAKVTTFGQSALTLELAIEPGLGVEGFRIAAGPAGTIRVIGHDERGLLYGVGKLLRSSRFDHGGFTPGGWRGQSGPQGQFRAIYLASHFRNFYETAPPAEMQAYLEDLALWGFNTVIVHFPQFQFQDFNDPGARKLLDQLRGLFRAAKAAGMEVGLVEASNQGFAATPKELLAQPVPDNWGRRGKLGVNLCPAKPPARQLLLKNWSELLDQFSDTGLDWVVSWPYDEGGCGCPDCWPWGSRGHVQLSKAVSQLARRKYPRCRFVLSTWVYDSPPAGEWTGLAKALADDKGWVDAVMADAHEDYPHYPLDNPVPGGLPLLNFPEISMWGRSPWGGFGATPLPGRFQRLWNQVKQKVGGGMPYSEGIYEDINKVICGQFYWNKDRAALDTVREYIAFEYSPDVVEDVLAAVNLLEETHTKLSEKSFKALELLQKAEARLTPQAKKSWRWRILYLRSVVDAERYEAEKAGSKPSPVLKRAYDELTAIQHAQHALQRPPQLP
jgi:hypothetical protein